jgi:hypothetical protein
LFLAVCNWNASVLITPDSGWITLFTESVWADANMSAVYYIDSGNKTPLWTLESNASWCAVGTVFKESSGSIPIWTLTM